ncbi:hypothetical protein BGZ91_003076, partial [Linnemannia elongata]
MKPAAQKKPLQSRHRVNANAAAAAAAHGQQQQGGPVGTHQQWMSAEAIARLQQEQEALRVQYLAFLHQLNLSNPHGFLVHMNTFAAEFPQEFQQLQSYIRFQEQITNQQREEAKRAEEM